MALRAFYTTWKYSYNCIYMLSFLPLEFSLEGRCKVNFAQDLAFTKFPSRIRKKTKLALSYRTSSYRIHLD